jgi:hypothetical protein
MGLVEHEPREIPGRRLKRTHAKMAKVLQAVAAAGAKATWEIPDLPLLSEQPVAALERVGQDPGPVWPTSVLGFAGRVC